MRMRWQLWLIIVPALTWTPGGYAASNVSDNLIYYEIGGARAVSPPVTRREIVQLDANVYAGSTYSCGNFNVFDNVEALLEKFKDGVDDLIDAMVFAANGAIAQLPAYVLQRANPGLYELFQNALWRYEEKARLAIKNCRQAEAEIARGENPYDDWIVVVNNTEWRRQAQAGSTATEAEESVRVEARHKGVIWRDGEAHGGDGQRPVHVIGDVARAGHEILSSGTSADSSGESGLVETYYPSEDEAAEWTTDVLGELVIDFKDGSAPQQQAGTGLGPKIDALKREVEELLTAMVHDRGQRTHENFQKVTAPAVAVTPEVIHAVRVLDPDERQAVIERLSSEIATARIAEQAIVTRRLLRAGVREANIAATPAGEHIYQVVLPELESEIQSIRFENEIRQALVSKTALAVLKERRARDEMNPRSLQPDPVEQIQAGGAVIRE